MLITGSWFEFQHPNPYEGAWNPVTMRFTANQWRAMITDMKNIGMEYLVLMNCAWENKTFYKSRHFESMDTACPDPMSVMFETADELGMKIFVANDMFDPSFERCCDMQHMFTSPEVWKRRESAMVELVERFGHHNSFYGWYWMNELDIFPNYSDVFIEYVNRSRKFADSLAAGKKTLIAPYGTFHLVADDGFCRQLERLDVDYIAYQDEIGVRKANVEWTPLYFERLRRAHDKVGRAALWADMETFEFEGRIYKSPLHAAPVSRVIRQLEAISPFVDRVLIYEYPGIMSRPGSAAHIATPGASELYVGYENYRNAFLRDSRTK